MADTIRANTDMRKEIEELKQARQSDKIASQRKVNNTERQLKMLQVEIVEKDGTIQKLRELVE